MLFFLNRGYRKWLLGIVANGGLWRIYLVFFVSILVFLSVVVCLESLTPYFLHKTIHLFFHWRERASFAKPSDHPGYQRMECRSRLANEANSALWVLRVASLAKTASSGVEPGGEGLRVEAGILSIQTKSH